MVSCLFMVLPAWAEDKSGRDVLPSAVGKTLRMPYSSMALTAKLIGPAIEEEDYYNWCVSPIMGKDNKVHIFSSRWPKRLGMEGWIEKEAEIAHFVGDRPEGPFRYVGSVLTSDMLADPATMSAPHNPRLEYVDGKYILLYICQNPSKTGHNTRIGMMIADDINGPWRFAGKNGGIVLDVSTDPANWTSKAVIGIYNPAFLKIKGKYYIYFNCPRKPHAEASYTYGCAVSDKLEGPYVITDAPVTDNVSYIEDAQAFSVGKTHYLLTTDNFGRNSGVYGNLLLWQSKDGLHFRSEEAKIAMGNLFDYWGKTEKEKEELLKTPHVFVRDASGKLERPAVLMVDGKPAYLYAVGDVNLEGGPVSKSYVFKIEWDE